MKILFLILMFYVYLFGENFFRNDNYVVDKKHKLMWQDTKINVTMLKNQKDSIKYCEDLKYLNFINWKLPTREQYEYILDKTRKDGLMINRKFKYILPGDYWTRETTWRSFGRYGYYIFLKSGTIYYNNKIYLKLIRCVREL